MKGYAFTFILIIAVFSFSCDATDSSFDDSVPHFYSLSFNSIPIEGGSLSPSEGEFLEGTHVEIEAVSSDGFLFEKWEGDISGNANPTSLTMTENMSVTAVFKKMEYSLNVEIIGEGFVDRTVNDQNVNLTAISEVGWEFSHWEGDLTGSENPESLLLNEDKNVTAVFEVQYKLNVLLQGEGSVEIEPEREYYSDGDEVTLMSTAASGWAFSEWKGDLTGSENPATITMGQNKSISAVFERCLLCDL